MNTKYDDDYEMTRNMLKTIRGGEMINEQEGEQGEKMVDEENSDDAIELTGSDLNDEQEKFRQTINPRVEFDTFKIYPDANNVVFSGRFQGFGGMEWQFTLEDSDGVYVVSENLQLTGEALNMLQKLRGYYENWADEWSEKIATEYKK